MTKADKHRGRVKPKHAPLPDPSKLEPKRTKRKKHPPRYLVEMWHEHWWAKMLGQGSWGVVGKAKTFDEAVHLMNKPRREIWGRFGTKRAVRIIDTETACVVRSIEIGATQPLAPPEGT